jgi:hypothetical protein
MDKLGILGKKNTDGRLTAMTEMIEEVGKLLHKNKGLEVVGDGDFFFGSSKEATLARNEMAGRIIAQNREGLKNYKGTSVKRSLWIYIKYYLTMIQTECSLMHQLDNQTWLLKAMKE